MVFIAFFDTGDWVRSSRRESREEQIPVFAPKNCRNAHWNGIDLYSAAAFNFVSRQPDSLRMRYCESPYLYQRRKTREVVVGDPRTAA